MPKINSTQEANNSFSNKIDWQKVSEDIKNKLGNDIFNSWIQKLKLVEEMDHYIVLSAPTRFIRDWVVSRYLDQIIKIQSKVDDNSLNLNKNFHSVSIIQPDYVDD